MPTTYVVPQVKVFQEFTQTPAAITSPLYAFVFGPNFFLQKYADDEGFLGTYDETADTAYSWPNRPAGAVVDSAFTKIYVKDALLRYYSNLAGATYDEIRGVPGYNNRIRAEAVNFAANGTSFPLDTAFNGRDVAVGDVAHVYANAGGTTYHLYSPITAIVADQSSVVIGTPTADAGNEATNMREADSYATAGATNGGGRTLTSGSLRWYDGIADGYASEVYTLTITTASISGEGALASLVSASGTDDDTEVAITGTASQLVGTRGLTFEWAGTGEWAVGDVWTIYAFGEYAVPALSASGTFDSDADITYIVECTTGGLGGTCRVTVTTTDGSDASGAVAVNDGVAFSIGTKGVTFAFDAEGQEPEGVQGFGAGSSSSSARSQQLRLIAGEKWYVACTGRANGNYRTLVLADDLPSQVRGVDGWEGSSSSLNYGSDLNLSLYVSKDIQLPREKFPSPPEVNWSQSATQITLESGAEVFDSDFVDSFGNYVTLYLEGDTEDLYSQVYVEYRALIQTYASDISSMADIDDVDDLLGEISEDNPLASGVWHALRNSNGTPVKYMAIPTNDLAGYNDVLDKATGRRDLYSFVPMTRDSTIQNTIAAHVQAQSTETKAQWRICFLNGLSSSTDPLIDVAEYYPVGGTNQYVAADLLATVLDNPLASGTQYTLVTWDATAYTASGGFVDMGVRAGDLFRTNYTDDGFGNTTYSDYVIDAVLSNQTLRLVAGPSNPNSVARKFSIQRSFTKTEEATAYGTTAGAFVHRRVYYVWPDVIEDASGDQIAGYYLCAAIAGLTSGVVPQQGLTNVEILGFTDVTRTTDYFSETQLDIMAGAGVWVVDRDPDTGAIYSRHEVSTCTTDLNCRELMVVKNVDSISYTFFNQLQPYIGRSNVTQRFMEQLRRQIMGTVDYLAANGTTPSLGGQLITAEIVDLRQHPVNLDQVIVELLLTIPYPVNVIELRLII